MKYSLALKAPVKTESGEVNHNELFHQYIICDDEFNEILATVAFTQLQDTGNVYSPRVRLSSAEMRNAASIFINEDVEGGYPASYYVALSSTRLLPNEITSYVEMLNLLSEIAECAMSVFELEEHRSKYYKGD